MNFSTLCTMILVAFGPETSEFTTLTLAPHVKSHKISQKSEYPRPSSPTLQVW